MGGVEFSLPISDQRQIRRVRARARLVDSGHEEHESQSETERAYASRPDPRRALAFGFALAPRAASSVDVGRSRPPRR